jgi:hypothetical protein
MRRSEIFKSLTFSRKGDEIPEREIPLPHLSGSQDEVII